MPKAKRALQILLGTAVGLAVAEGAFHLRDHGAFPHLNVYAEDAALGVRLVPGAEERVAFGGNPVTSVRVNAQGYRGADWPAPGGDEVLVVGDSMAFGLGVEEGEAFPARLEKALGGPRVRGAGVPTYGPPEYERVLGELLEQRRPKTVVYTLNMLNDPFEARRPNVERHRVWDGWAVRRESAPEAWTAFPGRALLFRDSHAVFALRQWLYFQGGGSGVARGVPSDGNLGDLLDLSGSLEAARAKAREETERRALVGEAHARYAALQAVDADLHVKLLAYRSLKLGGEQASVYLASSATPGDIVVAQQYEESSPLGASVAYVREAVALRERLEKDLRKRAEADASSADAKEILRSLDERDRLEKRLRAVYAAPLEIVRASLPIVDVLLRAKALCDAKGARFVLLVLPLDVQVSADEWKKYAGTTPADVAPVRVLEDDLSAALRDAGALVVDPTADLAAAEPGAYLDHDPHPSPKGHEAIAAALGRALRNGSGASPDVPKGPLLALPEGRSRIPRPGDWPLVGGYLVRGSDAAGCDTKRIREWVYVRCTPRKNGARPASARVVSGGHGDALVLSNDGAVSLVAPIVRGDTFEARFSWAAGPAAKPGDPAYFARRLVIRWPADTVEPEAVFEDDKAPGDPAPADDLTRLCQCWQETTGDKTCAGMLAAPSRDCLSTYPTSCKHLIECTTGWPVRMPRCPDGRINAGAELWCFTPCAPDGTCKEGACTTTQGARLCLPPSSTGDPAPPTPAIAATASPPQAVAAPRPALDTSHDGAPPQTPPQASSTADFDALAVPALDAAAAAAAVCKLIATDPGTWFSYISWDTCSWAAGEADAYAAKAQALSGYAERHDLPAPARTVADHARLFGEFLAVAHRAQNGRGTARLFQELILAWNAYAPDRKRDPDPPGIVRQYTEHFGDPKVDLIWSTPYPFEPGAPRRTPFDAHRSLPRPLAWRNGAQGPFLGD